MLRFGTAGCLLSAGRNYFDCTHSCLWDSHTFAYEEFSRLYAYNITNEYKQSNLDMLKKAI